MEKTFSLLSKLFATIACLALLAVMFITFFDVIGRYFFDAPLTFAVEIIQLGVGVIVLFGLAATTLERGHIAVDLIEGILPRVVKLGLASLAALAGAGFMALMAWRLWAQTWNFFGKNLSTDVLFLPVWPVVLAMAIGAALAAVISLAQALLPGLGGRPPPDYEDM